MHKYKLHKDINTNYRNTNKKIKGINKIRITVLPYDQIDLSAVPNIVCVGDSITIKATINTFATYQNYFWSINQIPSTTTMPRETEARCGTRIRRGACSAT